jgi:poly-gamma-glutamate synthesis protein (capsule biosynthesis protein)
MNHGSNVVRVVSGGDVMFKSPLAQLPAAEGNLVHKAFSHIRDADVCFMNCEMPLTKGGYRIEKTVNLQSDPIVARDLAEVLGIDVVTLANNHMLDYSYEGLENTLAAIDSVGLARVGAGADIDRALCPHFSTVNGIRFAFFGVAATLPPGSAAGVGRPGIAPIRVNFSFAVNENLMAENPGIAPIVHTTSQADDVQRVTEAITAAKGDVDHVIIAIHWGITRRRITPFQGMIAEYQGPLGRALIDAGADLVLGNHSHNLHGVEVYRGKPIFYSLGNFIFQDPRGYMEPESVIVSADFSHSGLRVQLTPVLVNDGGFPELVERSARDHVIRVIGERSEQFGTQFMPTPDGLEIDLTRSAA